MTRGRGGSRGGVDDFDDVIRSQSRPGPAPRTIRLALAALGALGVVLALAGCGSTAATGGHPSALRPIGAGLRGPAGLKATVYATGLPTVATLAFDSRSRLWAAAAGLSNHRRDGVYLIARPGARPLRVIAGLDDPLGLLWQGGTLYVASVGRVDAFSGLRGAHFTHRREIVVGPVAHGENNDLVPAPGGRLLLGITATCDHCRPKSRYSGSIVSFRTDGRGLRLYAARIRAPFGLTYYPGTSDLFVTMNQRDDLGARTPGDWLAVVRQGQSWGFPQCYGQGGAVCAGVPKPVAVLDPHAAAGSVVIVSGLGPAVGTSTALVSQWNVAKVQKVALRRTGSSYRGSVTPFLTGLENPLALVLAPDRSLLVGDWGTGRIYRIAPAS
jgi:glucose/arabinose dehydrogenase